MSRQIIWDYLLKYLQLFGECGINKLRRKDMKKLNKILASTMALTAVVAGGSLLAGCGDEFSKGETVTQQEVIQFLEENKETTFGEGYKLYMSTTGMKFDGTFIKKADDTLEMRLIVNVEDNVIPEVSAMNVDVYMNDRTIYVDTGVADESGYSKIKTTLDDESYSEYMDVINMAESYQTNAVQTLTEALKLLDNGKMLKDEETGEVRFKFEENIKYKGVKMYSVIYINFKDNKLVGYDLKSTNSYAGMKFETIMKVEGYTGAIDVPSNLDAYHDVNESSETLAA